MSKPQPKDGENIFHCGHKMPQGHWFCLPGRITLNVKVGPVAAKWFVVCGACNAVLQAPGTNLPALIPT